MSFDEDKNNGIDQDKNNGIDQEANNQEANNQEANNQEANNQEANNKFIKEEEKSKELVYLKPVVYCLFSKTKGLLYITTDKSDFQSVFKTLIKGTYKDKQQDLSMIIKDIKVEDCQEANFLIYPAHYIGTYFEIDSVNLWFNLKGIKKDLLD